MSERDKYLLCNSELAAEDYIRSGGSKDDLIKYQAVKLDFYKYAMNRIFAEFCNEEETYSRLKKIIEAL